jgi:YVTN family beta-propeller protein
MRLFVRSATLALAALLFSVVVFGYGSQASGPQVDLPSVVATIGVGSGGTDDGPEGVGVDTDTNRIFVANSLDNAVFVVNGDNNTVAATISDYRINRPQGVAVNSISRKVYVASWGRNSLVVIDADTWAVITEIPGLGPGPTNIAIDTSTNLVYVTNFGDASLEGQTVSVINGANDTFSTNVDLTVDGNGFRFPYGITLDVANHRAYVTHRFGDCPNYVTTFDTQSLAVSVFYDYAMCRPAGIAFRPASGALFVAQGRNSQNNPSVATFDFNGGTLHKLPWDSWGRGGIPLTLDSTNYYWRPVGLTYNPATERVFVNSYDSSVVAVIDAVNLTVLTALTVGANPDLGIAVNPVTSRVYVANRAGGSLTVIQDGSVGPPATPTITPTPTPLPCIADVYEPDDSSGQARAIAPTSGYTQSHSFCGASAPWYEREDWVSFVMNTSAVLTMTTGNLTNGADTYLELYGPNAANGATLLAGDDDGGGGFASRLVYTITQPGIYFLRVYNQAAAVIPIPQWNYDLAVAGGPSLNNRVFLPMIARR